MDELITKRALLSQYDISYGALYRWKRMGLIPEAWFIRKATPTGQETFFRRAQICPRVELILERGKDRQLEQLAKELAGAEEAQGCLILETAFEQRRIPLSELKRVALENGGQVKELLEQLKEEAR